MSDLYVYNAETRSKEHLEPIVANEIKLYVNGVLERTVEDNTYNLPEGLIGVGVSSFDSTPVIIDFDYVYIDVP